MNTFVYNQIKIVNSLEESLKNIRELARAEQKIRHTQKMDWRYVDIIEILERKLNFERVILRSTLREGISIKFLEKMIDNDLKRAEKDYFNLLTSKNNML